MLRSDTVRHEVCLCGLRTSVTSFPLSWAFPTARVLCVIRLPKGMRRAFPLTVLLRLPVRAFHISA